MFRSDTQLAIHVNERKARAFPQIDTQFVERLKNVGGAKAIKFREKSAIRRNDFLHVPLRYSLHRSLVSQR